MFVSKETKKLKTTSFLEKHQNHTSWATCIHVCKLCWPEIPSVFSAAPGEHLFWRVGSSFQYEQTIILQVFSCKCLLRSAGWSESLIFEMEYVIMAFVWSRTTTPLSPQVCLLLQPGFLLQLKRRNWAAQVKWPGGIVTIFTVFGQWLWSPTCNKRGGPIRYSCLFKLTRWNCVAQVQLQLRNRWNRDCFGCVWSMTVVTKV